ncbi:YggU family protein [Patescibacteria group bacterium]|nr:YggU family protein [Patescibacteria group bacterium]
MILTVEVKPKARKTKIVSWKDAGTVVIAIAAPATEGRANRELLNFLSKRLKIAKSLIEIKRGQGSRVKHISIPDNADLSTLEA